MTRDFAGKGLDEFVGAATAGLRQPGERLLNIAGKAVDEFFAGLFAAHFFGHITQDDDGADALVRQRHDGGSLRT